jgi:hypothetical protein
MVTTVFTEGATVQGTVYDRKGEVLYEPINGPYMLSTTRFAEPVVPQFSGTVNPAETVKVLLLNKSMNILSGGTVDPGSGDFTINGYHPVGPKYYLGFVGPTGYVSKIVPVDDPAAIAYRGNPVIFGNAPSP